MFHKHYRDTVDWQPIFKEDLCTNQISFLRSHTTRGDVCFSNHGAALFDVWCEICLGKRGSVKQPERVYHSQCVRIGNFGVDPHNGMMICGCGHWVDTQKCVCGCGCCV